MFNCVQMCSSVFNKRRNPTAKRPTDRSCPKRQQEERPDNTEEGNRVAVSQRTDSAVVQLVIKLAPSPGAHNPYALEPEIVPEAPLVHWEGVNTANNQTLCAPLRVKDCLASSSPTQEVGESVKPPLLKPHCERPRVGEQVTVRAGSFACSLPQSVSRGRTPPRVEVGKSVNIEDLTSITQATAALSEEKTLCHGQSGPCAAQSGPGAYQSTSSCRHLAQDVSSRPKPLKSGSDKVGKFFLAPDSETTAFLQWMEAVLEPHHAPQEFTAPRQPAESSNQEGPAQPGDEEGDRPELPKPEPNRRQGQEMVLAMEEAAPKCTAEECCDTERFAVLERNQYEIRDHLVLGYEDLR